MKMSRLASAACAAVAVAGVLAPAAAATSRAAAPRAAAPKAAAVGPEAAARPAPLPHPVFLISGVQASVGPRPGARGTAIVLPAGRAGGPLLGLSMAGRSYLLPPDAVPYLGRGLAPSLFDVGALASRERAGRLPVTVGFRGGVPKLPGVTITRAASGTAQGYLTRSGARTFGAALARQFAADHARGGYGQDGMFAGGVAVSLAGDRTPGQALPPQRHFPMHTVTITGTDLNGRPDTGSGLFLFSVDNANKFTDPVESFNFFYHGSARFSVPAGRYMAIAAFNDLSGTRLTGLHMDFLPQLTISRSTTTVHMAARAATSRLQFVTPRPASGGCGSMVVVQRAPAAGLPFNLLIIPCGLSLWVNPTKHTKLTGSLHVFTDGQLNSPAHAAGTPYEYDLAYAGPAGVVPPLRFVVRQDSLATEAARYYQPVASKGGWSAPGLFLSQFRSGLIAELGVEVRLPRRVIQYYSTGPSLLWFDNYFQSWRSAGGGQIDSGRVLRPGQRLSMGWNAFPLHPAPNTNLLSALNPSPTLPSASRAGDKLTLDITPFSDNVQGHTGSGFSEVAPDTVRGHYAIFSGASRLAGGNAVRAAHGRPDLRTAVQLPHGTREVRFVLTASRTGNLYRLSSASRTVWTWRSVAQQGTPMPVGWTCGNNIRSCAVQPMMTLNYAVAGLSLHGSARPGRQVLHLSARHLQLAKATAVTRAAVSVSFDGGKTWRPARLTGHDGSYTAVFAAPAGALVSLRTSAADAAGSSIAETITSAYQTSS